MKRERRLENVQVMAAALEAGQVRDLRELRPLMKDVAGAKGNYSDIGDFLQVVTDLYGNDAIEFDDSLGNLVIDYQGLDWTGIEFNERMNYSSAGREVRKNHSIDMEPFLEHFGIEEETDLIEEVERRGSDLRIAYMVSNFPEAGEARVRMRVDAPRYGSEELEDVYQEFLEPYVDRIWNDRIETLLEREASSRSAEATV